MNVSSAAIFQKIHLDPNYLPRKISNIHFYDNRQRTKFFQFVAPNSEFIYYLWLIIIKIERKNCIVKREIAFYKSSPVDKYHLPQINFEKVFLGCGLNNNCPLTRQISVAHISQFKIFILQNFISKHSSAWSHQLTTRGQSIINVQIYFDQLFRGHKKQFSDQFLELDNKWMIEIGSNTCDTRGLRHLNGQKGTLINTYLSIYMWYTHFNCFLVEIEPKTTQNMRLFNWFCGIFLIIIISLLFV
jgi:hypothetical protein